MNSMNVEVYVNILTGTVESNLCAVEQGFGYRKKHMAQIWTHRHINTDMKDHNLLTLSVVAWTQAHMTHKNNWAIRCWRMRSHE